MIEYKNFTNECGIYCFTNKVNGKCYVGQAVNLKKRLRSHYCAMKKQNVPNMIFYTAVAKYGIKNFDLEILEFLDPTLKLEDLKKALDEKEKFYIKEKNAYIPNGYNQTLGGDAGVLGYKMTDEQKDKIRRGCKEQRASQMKRIYAWNFKSDHELVAINAAVMSEITSLSDPNNGVSKKIISAICNNKYLHEYCKFFTFSFSKEDLYLKRDKIKEKIRNGLTLSENKGNFKNQPTKYLGSAVVEIDRNGKIVQEFLSVKAAAIYANRSSTSMRGHLRGKTKTCGGKHFKYKDPNYVIKPRNTSSIYKCIAAGNLHKNKPIVMLDKNGNILKEYNSIKECALDLHTDAKSISMVCLHKKGYNSCHGYKFEYK